MKLFYILLLVKVVFLNFFINASEISTAINNSTFSNHKKNSLALLNGNTTWYYYKHYTVISNIIEGQKPDYLNSLTLVLQVSNDHYMNRFKNHLINWEGLISLGIFMLNTKLISTETKCTICTIKYFLKNRKNVSVHFIFRKKINISNDDIIYIKEASYCDQFNFKNGIKSCITVPSKNKLKFLQSYPINILRNVARKFSQSKFLVISDFDQIFSPHFAEKVLPVVKSVHAKNKKAVFVIRNFETVSKNYKDGPKNKKQLHKMLKEGKAFVFHYRCIVNFGIPKLKEWFKVVDNNKTSIQFQAIYDQDGWEPKLIIPDDAPYNDENFPYSFADNNNIMWSLCLKEYKFLVLNNVFIYHLGVKPAGESKDMGKLRELNMGKYTYARKSFLQRHEKKYSKRFGICMKKPNFKEKNKLLSDNIFKTKKS